MNSIQFARILVRLVAVVLVVTSVVRAADFVLSLISGHFNFGGFVAGLLHAVIPAAVAAMVITVGEPIAVFLSKGNEQ